MIKGVIFDLDGVIVKTDDMHYKAWSKIASEENIYFDMNINHKLRGVSRLESLNIILEKSNKDYNSQQKMELADRKNNFYKEYISLLNSSDLLSGVNEVLSELKNRGFKIAIGSSSKNADFIINKIGLENIFDIIISGKDIKKTKPDPEIFSLAAQKMMLEPEHCVVVEDAEAGIEAAKAAGMKAVGIGNRSMLKNADIVISGLDEPGVLDLILC